MFSSISQFSRQVRRFLATNSPLRDRGNGMRRGTLVFRPGLFVGSLSLAVAASLIGLRQLGWLESLELGAYDRLTQLRPDEGTDPRLLIVAVTEKDLQTYGFPLPDLALVQLFEALEQYQPRAIGLDILRDMPTGDAAAYQVLMQHLDRQDNIVAICKTSNASDPGVPPPKVLANRQRDRVGFNDIAIDPDAVVRRALLFLTPLEGSRCSTRFSFGIQLVFRYLKQEGIEPIAVEDGNLQLGDVVFYPLNPHSGSYVNGDTNGYQIMLNYRSSEQVAEVVTLAHVLQGKLTPEQVRDRIVLIGVTAASAKDIFLTPYSLGKKKDAEMSGVMIHAQKTSQILSAVLDNRPLMWVWPDWGEALWIVVWAIAGGAIAWKSRHPIRLGVGIALSFGVLMASCYGALRVQSGWIPLVPPALSLAIASISVVAYKQLYITFHDELTGLPNRSQFLHQLEGAVGLAQQQEAYLFAVFFVGIDRFKNINDGLGHSVGDQLLSAIAQRLLQSLSSKNFIARVGGDEFAVLLPALEDPNQVIAIANSLQEKMDGSFMLSGQEIAITTSIGIVLGRKSDDGPNEILRNAHTAMHRAKSLGGSCHQIFDSGMHLQAVTRLQLETDLRQALAAAKDHLELSQANRSTLPGNQEQELQLYYQPLVSLETGKIIGFEALIRWHHPQRGVTSPALFIPLAEETGLVIPLGQWVLWEACCQLKAWQAQFPQDPPLMVSVNLSAKQFAQADLVGQIASTLENVGLDANSIKLEITESIVMEDVEAAIAMLDRIKALNLQISIDDFGTGYSSLSYLSRFPTDTLKIDRSFVNQISGEEENAAIVRTIVALAHNLGMDVIAEGVETMEQYKHLKNLGCECGQGYLFSQPLSSEAATELLIAAPQW